MKTHLLFLFSLFFSTALFAQKELLIGLQSGATFSTFNTQVTINNGFASTVPPINDLEFIGNFNIGVWVERRLKTFMSLRLELQRNPGGAKTFDAFEERLRRYKYFTLSTPLLLKITSFQQKARNPFQLELGIAPNFFLFEYGEEIQFGNVQKISYSAILGLTKNIDDKWAISVRYLRGITPFSQFEAGGLLIDWTSQQYSLTFTRMLFVLQPKKDRKRKRKKKRKRR